jgi:hypothetical protein
MWALMFVGLPLLARGLQWAAETIESRQGPSSAARGLRQAGLLANGVQDRLAPRRQRRGWWNV